jgi:hypothetical protein
VSAAYTPIARTLPAVFQQQDGFAQVDAYLGLVDDLQRAYLDRLDEVGAWLSPAASAWPPGLPLDAGADEVLSRYEQLYDELATWFGFTVPGSWPVAAEGLRRRRGFLLKAARLWRRRGTPRGFLDWFCLYFGVPEGQRPILLEHFKYGGGPGDGPGLRATLLVPVGEAFTPREGETDAGWAVARRREARVFVERYAPAHVLMRLCWVEADAEITDLPDPDDPATWPEFRTRINGLLCSIVDVTDHGSAIHLGACIDAGRVEDRLDTGRLPGGGASDL